MRIAVISDIHSNIYALEKVLEDIERRNVDLTVCLGDLVGYGTHPNEVIELIRRKNILAIMGNYDDAVGFERMVCGCDYPDPKDAENAGISLGWTVENTTEENKRFLRELPKEAVLSIGDRRFIFVHGSPRKINEYLKENSKEAEEVMGEIGYDILVCGHTHVPYFKRYYNKMLINSGSVGKPKNGRPDANYIIIDADDELKVEIMYVPYDYERAAQDMEEAGMPESFINNIRTGRA
ncbi:metallophosphoesterase family protein [Caloramator proteoclasticus]|uniref:Phosphoesterase n=1 Tax=Caloramator proteoclasticus DSM 10124 TaxID=1121262 RepID=A0A1M5AVQ0_9CLOT|nr:YfcE family phosphodiesterase [Caloramator proteoclasticus]SHF34280.1 phosphoesterase, MJ0936 family [Caloramator proteoclasticus DSM 10124]